jgi:hypothetical protein
MIETTSEAFFLILWAAVGSNGKKVSPKKIEELFELTFKKKLFKEIDIDGIRKKAGKTLQDCKNNYKKIIDLALPLIEDNLKDTLYVHCVDIIYANGDVTRREHNFLKYLQAAIDIDDELASAVIRVVQIRKKG